LRPIGSRQIIGSVKSCLRNEAYIVVNVGDVNDETPKIVEPSAAETIVGYPSDISLQQVVGPVLTVKVNIL